MFVFCSQDNKAKVVAAAREISVGLGSWPRENAEVKMAVRTLFLRLANRMQRTAAQLLGFICYTLFKLPLTVLAVFR